MFLRERSDELLLIQVLIERELRVTCRSHRYRSVHRDATVNREFGVGIIKLTLSRQKQYIQIVAKPAEPEIVSARCFIAV